MLFFAVISMLVKRSVVWENYIKNHLCFKREIEVNEIISNVFRGRIGFSIQLKPV